MESGGGAGSSSHSRQRTAQKSTGRPGTKSSGLQLSSSSQNRLSMERETIVMARKSKKDDDPIEFVSRTQDTRLSRYADDGRSLHVNTAGPSEIKMKSAGGRSSLQRSDITGDMAPPDTSQSHSQSQSRMKSSTRSVSVQRLGSIQSANVARKSSPRAAVTEPTSSRETILPSQLVRKGSRTPVEFARPSLSATESVSEPSRPHRDTSEKMERSIIDLTEQSGSSQHGSLLVLPSPSMNRNQPSQSEGQPTKLNFSRSKLSTDRKTTQDYGETPLVGRRLSVITPSESVAHSAKSRPSKLYWQLDDEERAKEQEILGRTDPVDRDMLKRIVTARHATAPSQPHPFKNVSKHSRSYLGHNLMLRTQGEQEGESDSDSPMEIDGPSPPRIRSRLQQFGVKAARKREWPPQLFDPEDEDELVTSSDEVDELDSSDSPEQDSSEENVDDYDIEEILFTARRQRSSSPADIEILPGPPRPPSPPSVSDGLMKAIDALSLSSVRMQSTKQLPFLRRNLRRGFIERCRQLGVLTDPDPEQDTRLRVQYHYGSEIVKARLWDWACPLCELHGSFPTREALACHLSWDHEKITVEWKYYQSGVWSIRLTINDPATELDMEDEHGVSSAEQPSGVTSPSSTTRRYQTNIPSPFPFVTLSPPEPQPVSIPPSVRAQTRNFLFPVVDMKARLRDSATPFASTSRDSHSLITSSASTPLSSRERSLTTVTAATATTTSTPTPSTQQRRHDIRYPTPPPPSNPLGPAAQPPYLPAKSEYGGPDIHYSCRPGGARLYDLLNTLPLEPYGMLAWEVLDREDEIYDSDNVRDEYKVMHALWGRWIMLNRNTFIKDYYKGTQAFIDFYWRMIHRAAGWDALRYWLLMLVVNRFITGAEVARLLKHYESLTGMDTWDI